MTTPTQKGYSVNYYNDRKSVSIDTCGVSGVGLYGGVMRKVGKKRRYRLRATIVVIGGIMMLAASVAFGDPGFEYSYVAPPPVTEANHAQILNNIYGGTFAKSGVNYSNGTISALRVYDSDNEYITLNLLTQNLDGEVDQIWTDGQATITAKAKYAALYQSFGWNGDGAGGTGTTYIPLLTEDDIGGPGVPLLISGDFLWGCWPTQRYSWQWDDVDQCNHWYDNQGGYWHRNWPSDKKWWSMESQNADDGDHMVTYKIDGLGNPQTVWLVFMEDLSLSVADRDYNDFVVEISAIPEPATAFMLIAGAAILLRKRLA